MCGIASVFGIGEHTDDVKSMIKSISHRGPDGQGFFRNNLIQMGSCRLSIFDLSDKGKMPMEDKSKRFTIIYNGEIYNFKDLKRKYQLSTFSNSDTEVLIELFSKIGEKSFEELNGIFAFIIYDNFLNKVYCVRDRLGVKPLYYSSKNNFFYFCSEIKGILNVLKNTPINENIVKDYLSNSFYDHSKETFYKDIYQVKQGTFMVFDIKKNSHEEKSYWSLAYKKIKSDFNYIDECFQNSLKLQQQSDTKIGLNVSSGIDSNMMMAYLNKINNGQKNIVANSYFYSDEEFDHRKQLDEMSLLYNWKIDKLEITSDDIINNFDEIAYYQDEPFPGINTISKHLLIKKNYFKDCKVVLEGQGGDDIAAGYKYYFPLFILDKLKNFKIIDAYKEISNFNLKENLTLKKFLKFSINSIRGFYEGGTSADGTLSNQKDILNFDLKENKLNYKNKILDTCNEETLLKKVMYRDIFHCKLPRILRSVDRASMAYGKEIRVPILDHNIVEYFYNLEPSQLINNGTLRPHYRNLYFYKFKENKFMQASKAYMPDPQTKWLKTSLYSWMYDRLSSSKFDLNGLINKKKLINYIENFKKDEKIKNSNFIWQLLNLENLYKNN
jgi:asparagine synthase (glutamine-hydrolysing)|tara:strand:+ start:2317 stop:4146 length:1830 start_codon:yes stop_codon:yes gene_type:complete